MRFRYYPPGSYRDYGGHHMPPKLSGVGTVTSVGLTMPAGYTVTGSPVTSSGTLAVAGGPVGMNGNTLLRYAVCTPAGSTTFSVGLTTTVFTGAGALATTGWLASMARGTQVCGAAANSGVNQTWNGTPWLWLGNAAGLGGFGIEFTVGYDTTCSRSYVGLVGVALNVAAVNPSTAVNAILFGNDAGDANLQIMHNDAAGACTKIDLGANFPAFTAQVAVRVAFASVPNSGTVQYTVTRLDNTAIAPATGTLSTNLPANTLFLFPAMGMGNAGIASSQKFAFVKLLIEEYMPQ